MTPERRKHYRNKQVIKAIKICGYDINKGIHMNIPKGFVYTICRGGKFFRRLHRWLE